MTNEYNFLLRLFLLVGTATVGPILFLAAFGRADIPHYLRMQYLTGGIVLLFLSVVTLRGMWAVEQEQRMLKETIGTLSVREGVQDALD